MKAMLVALAIFAMLCTVVATLGVVVSCLAMGANAKPPEIRALKLWMLGLTMLGVAGVTIGIFLLRAHPNSLEALAAALASRAKSFIGIFPQRHAFSVGADAACSPGAHGHPAFHRRHPSPNYMSTDRSKPLLRWGPKTFPAIAETFSALGVDFKPTVAAFEYALRPDDTRRK